MDDHLRLAFRFAVAYVALLLAVPAIGLATYALWSLPSPSHARRPPSPAQLARLAQRYLTPILVRLEHGDARPFCANLSPDLLLRVFGSERACDANVPQDVVQAGGVAVAGDEAALPVIVGGVQPGRIVVRYRDGAFQIVGVG